MLVDRDPPGYASLSEQRELKLKKKSKMMTQPKIAPLLTMNSIDLPPDVAAIVHGIMGARRVQTESTMGRA
jgi:hypothetical protein